MTTVTMADVKKLGWSAGQATSQQFLMMLEKCVRPRRLGKAPLTVMNCSPGVQVKIANPLRKEYWLEPDTDIEDLTDQFVSEQMDNRAVLDRFLSGQLKLRAKCWQISSEEIMLLSNKPTRRIIIVSLKKGDTITFENTNGMTYAIVR